MKDELISILKKSSRRGSFNPFSYSIGLETTVTESIDFIGKYPLKKPFRIDEIENLGKSLAFIHEYTHLHQYLCTAYGLRYLRITIIALNRMAQNKPVEMPLMQNLNTDEERDREDMNRYLAFIEATDQMRIHKNLVPKEEIKIDVISWVERFTSIFYMIPNEKKRIDFLTNADPELTIKKLPHLLFKDNEVVWDIPVTAALLMEAYAILVEVNHINNAVDGFLSLDMLLDIVPQLPEYRCVIEFAYKTGVCRSGSYLPILFCIDLALMYDPFTLYNVSVSTKPPGQVYEDVYPGETFMRACAAAATLDFKGYEFAGEYYEQLCNAVGTPHPMQMARKTFEIADKLCKNARPGALLSSAIKMHTDILKQRCENPLLYPITLSQRSGIWDSFEHIFPHTTFYHLSTGVPMGMRYVKEIDLLTIHDILFQILYNERIKCPMKAGHPFKCMNYDKPQENLCLWHDGKEKVGECLVDVIEKFLRIDWKAMNDDEDN